MNADQIAWLEKVRSACRDRGQRVTVDFVVTDPVGMTRAKVLSEGSFVSMQPYDLTAKIEIPLFVDHPGAPRYFDFAVGVPKS